MSDLIYLAGPYSHPDADVRQQRFVEHCIAAAKLADLDRCAVFAPVVHGHALCDVGGLVRLDHAFWMRQCLPFLERADVLVLLTLDGWRESQGTRAEIELAEQLEIPVIAWTGNDPAHIAELLGE